MRRVLIGLSLIPILLIGNFAWRARPVLHEKESYNAVFPKEKFLAKMRSPIPEWMARQIDSDFKGTFPITVEAIEKAYDTILSRVPEAIYCYHYRIIDNQLYKYIPPNSSCSPRDTYFEKAFKTLLSQTQIPDVDFVVIPMDGIPESFMSPDFYLMEDPREQIPILGQAKLKEPLTRSIVLIPDQLSLSDGWYTAALEMLSINDTIPWSEKIGKAMWRGGVTDSVIAVDGTLPPSPRLNLCRLSKCNPEYVDALFYTCAHPMAHTLLEQEGLFASFMSKQDQLRYKYLPVLDGHMCTYPGFQWRLLSNTLTLKQESDQMQWFYSALQPYHHYLPIAHDMSDLIEKVKWAETHEEEVMKMIDKARQFMTDHLMYEDCYRYLYLVFQKYATVQQIDFKALKQKTKKDPCWINIQYRKRAAIYKMLKRACRIKSLRDKKSRLKIMGIPSPLNKKSSALSETQ